MDFFNSLLDTGRRGDSASIFRSFFSKLRFQQHPHTPLRLPRAGLHRTRNVHSEP